MAEDYRNNLAEVSQKVSCVMYGIAIMEMVWQHLFCWNKVNGWQSILSIRGQTLEYAIGMFYSCVSIYAFLSGYGMCKKSEKRNAAIYNQGFCVLKNDMAYSVSKYFGLMKYVWMVYILFVPIGIFIYKNTWTWKELILNFFGLSSSINHQWWYIRFYICLLIIFPFIDTIFALIEKIVTKRILFCACIMFMLAGAFINKTYSMFCLGSYMVFVSGYMCAKFQLLDKIRLSRKKAIASILMIIAIFGFKYWVICIVPLGNTYAKFLDAYTTPLFVYAVTVLYTMSAENKLWSVFSFFGKHSTVIWLTHTFFCYYYWQDIIVLPKLSILVYLWTLLLSSIVAILVEYIINWLETLCKKYIVRKNGL